MNCDEPRDRAALEILQIAFKSRRLAYFANRSGAPVETGSFVIVSVDRGEDMGRIVAKYPPEEVKKESLEGDFLRIPGELDLQRYEANREFEKEVLEHCARRVKVRNLEMRLTGSEVQLDRNRIRIFFTADQRTDFRGLVRDMASAFRARIEMRQIGVRDDAKHKDGVGICGRRLCCAEFLNDFRSVTLKSVREQGLSPNPSKVSGACSRLMCCLEYETDFYRKASKAFPRTGSSVKLAGEQVTVGKVDIFRDKVSVIRQDESEELMDIEEFHRMRTAPPSAETAVPRKEKRPPGEKKEQGKSQEGSAEDSPSRKKRGRRRHRRKKPRKTEEKD